MRTNGYGLSSMQWEYATDRRDPPASRAMTVAGVVLLLLAAALFLASPAHAQNAPAKPTGFTATGGSHQVALAWTDPSDSTILRWQYRYKETGAYGSWTDVPGGSATTTSYTVTGLANSKQYTFQIRAGNSGGDGAASDEKTATMAPAKPGFFVLTLFVDTPGVQFGWSSTDPNDSTIDKWQYRQRKGTGAFGEWTEIPKSDWYTFRLSLEADQYSFQIRVVNESGNGDPSHIRSATFAKGICSRTAAVQTAIIALYKSQKGKDLTCGEVTGKELYELSGGLNLGSKSLTSLKAGDFDGLGNLGGVSLSNNSLTTLPADVFKGLARVRSLSLDGNQLTALPAGVFDDFGGLNILSLNGNKIASLRSDVFASQSSLLEVHLWDNELTTLPAGVFSKLSKVRRLRLENNKLSSLPAGAFRGLWLESVLNLSGNKLTTLTKGVFDGLKLAAAGSVSPSVALDLSGNDLTSLPSGVFDKLTKMRRLELQNNDLTSLPSGVFDKLPDLWMLNLNGNDIASLPADVFDKNPKLGWLDLGGNELASLTVDAFAGLSKLVQLRLNDNSLTKLPQAVFGDQSSLKILYLRGNALLCLPDIPQSVTLLTLNSNLSRDNMKPCAPSASAAPALTGGHKKLDVSWQAPSHSIGGSVTDYDLRYRAGTSGAWTNWSHTGTGRTATITGLTNAVSYQVQVRAANALGIGAWSAAGSASPVSGIRIVLSETGVTVAEGGTATYTVKLGVAPDAGVTVAVARSSGDTNITVSGGSSLTFTTATWDTAQTVTLAAAEDPDLQNSSATITHTASSTGEYNGTTATLTATEGDNDTAGLVAPATAEVLEGGTKDYTVKLSQQPSADVTVTVTRVSGDGSLSVKTGSSLTFSTTDWNIPQTVTLQAAQDPDHARGTAVFRHAASGGGYNGVTADLTATENDDDTLGMVLSKSSVKVPEGGQTAYTVKLGTRPTGGNVQVTVARKSGGDTDLTVKTGALLSFTNQNWDTPQDVILQAAQDADALHGTAAFVHTSSGADYGGLSKELTATEADDEVGLVLSKTRATVPEGGTATYTVKLKGLPTATVTVTVGRKAGGDTHLTADTDSGTDGDQNTLTFTTTNWSTAQTVTLSAADDPDNVNGEAVFTHAAAGGQYTRQLQKSLLKSPLRPSYKGSPVSYGK